MWDKFVCFTGKPDVFGESTKGILIYVLSLTLSFWRHFLVLFSIASSLPARGNASSALFQVSYLPIPLFGRNVFATETTSPFRHSIPIYTVICTPHPIEPTRLTALVLTLASTRCRRPRQPSYPAPFKQLAVSFCSDPRTHLTRTRARHSRPTRPCWPVFVLPLFPRPLGTALTTPLHGPCSGGACPSASGPCFAFCDLL